MKTKKKNTQNANIANLDNKNKSQMPSIEIWTDGSCEYFYDDEYHSAGPGGWGAVLKQNDQTKEIFGHVENTTNNRMEMMAVIEAIKLLKKPCNIKVFSDSTIVVEGGTNMISNKSKAKKKKKNMDLWKIMINVCLKHKVAFTWVKAHNGTEMNERADMLAKKGLYSPELKVDNPAINGSISNIDFINCQPDMFNEM